MNDYFSGTLSNISGWTEYSSDPSEQDGHFLVLNISASPETAKVLVEQDDVVINSVKIADEASDIFIFRIEDVTDTITITAYNEDPTEDDAVVEIYTLNTLTLETAPAVTPVILTVIPEDPTLGVLDKVVSDLQSNIVIDTSDKDVSGNLNAITGWTEYSSDPSEQDGHFLVLNISASPETATLIVKLGEVVVDCVMPDTVPTDTFIFRITDKDTDVITVAAYNVGETLEDAVVETYTLTGLELEA